MNDDKEYEDYEQDMDDREEAIRLIDKMVGNGLTYEKMIAKLQGDTLKGK